MLRPVLMKMPFREMGTLTFSVRLWRYAVSTLSLFLERARVCLFYSGESYGRSFVSFVCVFSRV